MKLSRGTLSLLTILLVVFGAGAFFGWPRLTAVLAERAVEDEEESPLADISSGATNLFAGAQQVTGAAVRRDTLWIQVLAEGEAAAQRRSEVATRTAGVVEQVFVQEGQRVEAGELLVQLDTAEAALNLAQARSAHLTATADYHAQMLAAADDPALTSEQREQRELVVRHASGLLQAEMNLERAEQELEWTQVRAPFGGVVADLVAVEGAFLGSGREVLTLLEIDPIRIEVYADEADVASLQPGRRASIHLRGLAHDPFTAQVVSVNPLVDIQSRSTRVTLQMPNPEHRVFPGMHARVSLDARSYEDRILVPREAIVERDRREVVFVVRDMDEQGQGIAEQRPVTTGFRNESYVEIVEHVETAMLEPGEVVLVENYHTLANEVPVRILNEVQLAGETRGGR